MRFLSSVLLIALGLILIPVQGEAQTQFRGIEASVGYAGWTGDNVDLLEPGVRTRLTLYGEASRRLGVGLTGVWGQVPIEGLDDNANELGMGVTLRQALGSRDRPHVFIDLYAGWAQLGIDLGDASPDLREDGLALGPGLGVEIPVGSTASFTLGGDFLYYSYDQIRFESDIATETDDAGWRYGFQLGLHLAF